MDLLHNKNIKGILYAALAFFIYNVADAFVKDMSVFYHGAYIGLWTASFTLIFILLFLKNSGKATIKGALTSSKRKWLIIRGILSALGFLCFLSAVGHIDLATAYALLLTTPFWASLLAFSFYKEKVGWHRLLAIFIGFIGVLIVLRPENSELSLPEITMLSCSFLMACGIIVTRHKLGETEPVGHILLYIEVLTVITTAMICLLLSLFSLPEFKHLFSFACAGFFYFLGMVLSIRAFAMAETSAVAPMHYTQIIWGSLIGYFIFQEIPDKYTVLGGTIIVASGLYLIYREHKTHHHNTKVK